MSRPRCLVVGAGVTGREHLKAVRDLGLGTCAGYAPSDRHREAVAQLGVAFFSGPLAAALRGFRPTHAVVVVPVEQLAAVAASLLELGVGRLLIEKPAALDSASAEALAARADDARAVACVAYNRRFYGSTLRALRTIEEAGEAIRSVAFEFTEWSDRIEALPGLSPAARARWLIVNSLHPIDLALHPVGLPDPARSTFQRAGRLSWHTGAAIMVGAGLSEGGVPFACHADWGAPGRWGVEWRTASTRFVLRPLEELRVMRRGSLDPVVVPPEDDLDERYKPGFFRQAEAFLAERGAERLASLRHGARLVALGEALAGY